MATLSQHSIHHINQAASHPGHVMPHGLGLLTTVASLPPKYRSRYLNIKTKIEIPLDLSVKQLSPMIIDEPKPAPARPVLPAVSVAASCAPPVVAKHISATDTSSLVITALKSFHKPITPPLTPPKRRKYSEPKEEVDGVITESNITDSMSFSHPTKMAKTEVHLTIKREVTPSKPIKVDSPPKTTKAHPPQAKPSKNKATRKLKFDEDTSSPVSGTIIRPLEEITEGSVQYSNGDIDPKYNIVEITEETKAELAAIKNVIGDYVCKLCRIKFDDAFGLARHRCSCIVLLEYRCPECGKQFNCPANLASHRRWHKPKVEGMLVKKENRNAAASTAPPAASKENQFGCEECGKTFKRQAYLRKHKLTHKKDAKLASSSSSSSSSSSCSSDMTTSVSIKDHHQNLEAHSTRSVHSGSVSSNSSVHSYNGHEEEVTCSYDYEVDTMSNCSSSSSGRLQIVESHNHSELTEEENIAAAALANLRNCTSVIQHTTVVH